MARRNLGHEIAALLSQQPRRSAITVRRPHERLEYKSIGKEDEPWPAWIRAYARSCGVYVIREGGRVVYVGSSKSRLYDTVTRHFQQWHRRKNYWKGMFGAGHDPGMTYKRDRCTVAIFTVPCNTELEAEARTIERLRPRDNLTEHPDGGKPDDEKPDDDGPIPF